MRQVLGRGIAGSTLLSVGGFCYAPVPTPGWTTEWPLLRATRSAPWHLGAGVGLSALGLALLTWAWWGLHALARDEVDGVRRVRIAAATWSVPLLVAPPLFSGDGWSYVATGFLTGRGLSPYTFTPAILPAPLQSGVNARWLHTPSPYGPLALGWGGAWSQLTSDPWLLLFGYRALALLGLALLGWAVPRLARRGGVHPGAASWLVLASPFVLAHGVGGLHNDLAVAGLGAAALAVSRRDRWMLGAALVGAAASVKLPGGLVGAGVVLLSLAASSGIVVRVVRILQVATVAGLVLIGLGWVTDVGTGWVRALSVATAVPSRLAVCHDLGTLLGSLPGVHASSAGRTVQVVAAVGVALAALVVVLVRPPRSEPRVLRSVAVLVLAITVLGPAVHYWYFLWCLPLLACAPLTRRWRAALVAELATLGLTAFVDPSLHLAAVFAVTSWSLLLVPIATYIAVRAAEAPAQPASAYPRV